MLNTVQSNKLLSAIRNASSLEEALSYHREHPEPTFSDMLKSMTKEKHIKTTELIKQSRVERSYFFRIKKGEQIPERNTALRIALCMNCRYDDINRFLRLSGHAPLNPEIMRDAMIIYGISRRMPMEEINSLLVRENAEPLYKAK
ncbi:MAG: hypothetical protein IJT77_05000 [Clostridia bacterium]|nr:hypothetical protein [Clostridia bacterium]